jgi:hypothetical protein
MNSEIFPSVYVLNLCDDYEDDKTILPEFLQINLIDSILQDFLDQYDLKKLLASVEEFGYGEGFTYKFNDVTYNGTFADYKTRNPDFTRHHQLTIRLSHDGFRYPKVPDNAVIEVITSHSTIPGFQVLTKEYITQLTTLQVIQKQAQAERIKFLYNRKFRRIDIEFFSDEDGEIGCLKICFENGSPKDVNKKEYLHDLRT